jgi:nucleoside-diphosphate-sugar epimerase
MPPFSGRKRGRARVVARVLIAGCGYVGTALAARLIVEGHQVWTLRRSRAAPPRGAVALCADLTDVDSLRLPPRLDNVFYTASADRTDDRSYRSAYVDGLRYLLAALDGHPVRRIVFTSSTGVYAQSHGEWVDEDSPVEPTRFSGERLLEGERLLRLVRFPATVVRFAGIYGPGRARLIERVRKGEAAIPRGGPVYANRIHRDDCVGVLRYLMMLERAGPLYVAADEEPAETAVVLRWIAERLGVQPPNVDPLEEGARYGRTTNKRVRSTRLLASGYRFRYPTFREGYGELIASGQAAGD